MQATADTKAKQLEAGRETARKPTRAPCKRQQAPTGHRWVDRRSARGRRRQAARPPTPRCGTGPPPARGRAGRGGRHATASARAQQAQADTERADPSSSFPPPGRVEAAEQSRGHAGRAQDRARRRHNKATQTGTRGKRPATLPRRVSESDGREAQKSPGRPSQSGGGEVRLIVHTGGRLSPLLIPIEGHIEDVELRGKATAARTVSGDGGHQGVNEC